MQKAAEKPSAKKAAEKPSAKKAECRVYNQKLLNSVLSEVEKPERESRRKSSQAEVAVAPVSTMREQRREDEEAAYNRRMDVIRQRKMDQDAKREREFQEQYKALKEGDQTLVASVSEYLRTKDAADTQKRTTTHTEWSDRVFNRVQYQVLSEIEGRTAQEISDRRAKLYEDFLTATNRKGGLYLDIVINSEYDPFEWKKHQVKYNGTILEDPMKKDLAKAHLEEIASRLPGQRVENTGNGRETLPMNQWGKIEATPFFDRVAAADDLIKAGRPPKASGQQKANIQFDHYKKVENPHKVCKEELAGIYGRGKKVFADWQPGKTLVE